MVVRPADETAKTEAPSRNQCLEMRGTVIQRLDFLKIIFSILHDYNVNKQVIFPNVHTSPQPNPPPPLKGLNFYTHHKNFFNEKN